MSSLFSHFPSFCYFIIIGMCALTCKGPGVHSYATADFTVETLQDVVDGNWKLNDILAVRTTSGVYRIQATAIPGYPADGIAVIALKNAYAILQTIEHQKYNVRHFDLSPDNASTNINKAIRFCAAQGGGTIFFPKGNYVLRKDNDFPRKFGAIQLRPKVSLEGADATLILRDATAFISARSAGIYNNRTAAQITQAVNRGEKSIKVNSTAGFSPGDEVLLRVGDNEWDERETKYALLARVQDIHNDNELVLNRAVEADLNPAKVKNSQNRLVRKLDFIIKDISISGFTLINDLTQGANAHSGIDVRGVENLSISNIKAIHPGAGAILIAYGTNVQVSNVQVLKSFAQNNHPARGRGINIWNSTNCKITNLEVQEFEGHAIFCESYSKNIQFENVHIIDNYPARNRNRPYINHIQDSDISLKNLVVEGRGGSPFISHAGTKGTFTIEDLTIKLQEGVKGSLLMNQLQGYFKWYDFSQQKYLYFDIDQAQEYTVTVPSNNKQNNREELPEGLILSYQINTSNKSNVSQTAEVLLGRAGIQGKQRVRLSEKPQSANFGLDYKGSMAIQRKIEVTATPTSRSAKSMHPVSIRIRIAPIKSQK